MLAAILVFSVAAGAPEAFAGERGLEPIAAQLARQYPGLVQVTPDELASRRADATVVIDARTPAEYEVSHIEGAIRVDATSSPNAVADAAGDVAGKSVVVYCTVGGRSSRVAAAAQSALLSKGAKDVANLTGGVLAWHNAGLPLVNAGGRTELVHPSSPDMARLLTRSGLARMSLDKASCPGC
jgi:rhodanese-related sulfurtransferase